MKKLIYFTVGNNPNYVKLVKLCIDTLYKHNYDGDFLFITDLKESIKNEIEFKNEPLFIEVPQSNLALSSANKLKIHLYDKIESYDKIIFCDSDILWLDNPDRIFDMINEDLIYISNESPLMSRDVWWGGHLLTEEEKMDIEQNQIKAMNAGFFCFNKNMIKHIKNIDMLFSNNPNLVNHALEQPFINIYLYRNKLYDTSISEIVTEKGCELSFYNGVVLHFAGGPGDFGNKYTKMFNYYEKNIK